MNAPTTQGDRPHKDFAGFRSEDSQMCAPIFQVLSDTEACAGLSGGAACIAIGIRAVENKKSLCSLDFLVLLCQDKSTIYLNLPEQIEISMNGLNHIKYMYSASGTKLAKHTVEDGVPQHTTDYVGSFVYEDGQLQYILTEEGRIVFFPDGNHEYQYFLKDHLGNTRITFTENGSIIQEDSYYPFGMAMAGLKYETGTDLRNQYLYNGKELQDDFGLEWYDYGARFYDPAGVHWNSVDPMAEEFPSWTPYHYVHNNPILLIDPTGMAATKYEDEEGNLLLNTDDGSDAVVTVTDDKRKGFDAAVKGTKDTDDVTWNNTMKKYALGFELSGAQEGLLSMMNSDWSRKNAISYWQNPTIGNSMAFAFSEALSQWTNPELVVAGLSAGVAGFSSVSRTSVYRVYGGDAKASGFSWTPKNPGKVSNFRNAAGLPSGGASGANNTGRFVIKGTANYRDIIKSRSALPLDGNKGGFPEYIINPKNVTIKKVSGVNPEF
jgi:RHS repeat-associated protein